MRSWQERVLWTLGVQAWSFGGQPFVTSCGGQPIPYDVPPIEPIVAAAMPAALRPGHGGDMTKRAPAATANDDAALYLRRLYRGLQPDGGAGIINSRLAVLDARLAQISSRAREFRRECLAQPPTRYRMDASAVDAALSLDLDLQCSELFGESPGSGIALGRRENDYSVWQYLKGGASIGYFGRVTNSGEPDELVDAVFLTALVPSAVEAIRIKARRGQSAFEVVSASTQSGYVTEGTDGGFQGLGPGYWLVSDGTQVWATGELVMSSDFQTPTPFEVCLDAATLTLRPTTECAALSASRTLPGSLSDASLQGKAALVEQLITIDNARAVTGDFNDAVDQ